MFTTGYIKYFFLYLEEGKMKYLNLTITFLILATYTKGVQGILFLPVMFNYATAVIAAFIYILFLITYPGRWSNSGSDITSFLLHS